ncbi:MFS transporter [Nocardia sp. NPDC049220]|uniref:MFS transporter n=1 Tax=Nocardia sp. NPDC049220 TaxID=3155273 RepID=UPI0033DE8954
MTGPVLPGVPEEITRWIIGHSPVGNPAAMRSIADALARSADQLTGTLRRVEETVARDAPSAIEGATGTAMRDVLGKQIDYGHAQVEGLRSLAKLMHEAANAIELEQYTVRAIGIALLLTITGSVGTQTLTARLNADIAANQARRRTLTWLLQRCTAFRQAFPMLAPAVSGALMGSISMGGATAAAQYVQIAQGEGKPGRVTEMDGGKVGVAVAAGAIGGATGGMLAPKLVPWLNRLATSAGLPMPTALAVLSTAGISGAAGGLTGGLTAFTLTGSEFHGRNLAEMVLMGVGGGVVGGLGAAVHAARIAPVAHTPIPGEAPPRVSAEPVARVGEPGHATGDSGRSRSEYAPPGEAGPAPDSGDGHTPKPELSPEMTQLGKEIAGEVARNPRLDDYTPEARPGALEFAAEHAADAPAGLGRFREIGLSRWQRLADAEAHQMLAGLHGGTGTPPGTSPPPVMPPSPGGTPSASGHGPGWPAWNKVFEQFRTGAVGVDSPMPTTETPGRVGTAVVLPPAASAGSGEPGAAQMALAGNVIQVGALAGVEAGPAAGRGPLPGPMMNADGPPQGMGSAETHVAAARDLGGSGSGSAVMAHPGTAHTDARPPTGPGPRGPARGGGLGELPPDNDTPFLLDLGFLDSSKPRSPETPNAQPVSIPPQRDTPAATTNPAPATNSTPHLASDIKGQPPQTASAHHPHGAPPATTTQRPTSGADPARSNPHGDNTGDGAQRSDGSAPRNDNVVPLNSAGTNTSHASTNTPSPALSPQSLSGAAPTNPPAHAPTSPVHAATPVSVTAVPAAAVVPAVIALSATNDPVSPEPVPETSDPTHGADFATAQSDATVPVPQASSPGPGSGPDVPHPNTERNSPALSSNRLDVPISPISMTGATTPAAQATAADMPVGDGLPGDDELPKRPEELPAALPPDATPRHSSVFPDPRPAPEYPANNDHPVEWQYQHGSGYYLIPGAPKIQEGPPPNAIPAIERYEDSVLPAQRDARPATYTPPNLADPIASPEHDNHDERDEETRQTPIPDVSPLPRHSAATETHSPATEHLPQETPGHSRYATPPNQKTPGAPEDSSLPPQFDPDNLAYIFERSGVPRNGAVPGTQLAPQQQRKPVEQPLPMPMMMGMGKNRDSDVPDDHREEQSAQPAAPSPSEPPSSQPFSSSTQPTAQPNVDGSDPPAIPPNRTQGAAPEAINGDGESGQQNEGSSNRTSENPEEPAVPATTSTHKSVLTNTPFMWYATGQTLNLVGTGAMSAALPLVMLDMTGSPMAAGLSTSALFIPKLFDPLAGYIADFYDRWRTMVIAQSVGLAAAGTATGLILFGTPNLGLTLTAATLVEATAATVHLRVFQTSVRDFLTDADRDQGNRLANLTGSVGSVGGPALGPLLLGVANSWPFGANTLSYVGNLAVLRKIRDSFPRQIPKDPVNLPRELGVGARALWQEKFLREYTAITMFNNAAWGILAVRTATVLHEAALPHWATGAVLSASAVGGIASFFLPRWINDVKITNLHPVVLASTAGFYTLQVATTNPAVMATGMFFGSLGIMVMNNRISTYQQSAFPGNLLGRVMGVKGLFQGVGPAVGGIVGGAVATAYGGDATGAVGAGVAIASAAYGLSSFVRRSHGLGESNGRGRRIFGLPWRSNRTQVAPAPSNIQEPAGAGPAAHAESNTPGVDPAAVIENCAIQLSRVVRALGRDDSVEPDDTDPRWDSDENWKVVELSIGAQIRPIKYDGDPRFTAIAESVRARENGIDTVVLVVEEGRKAHGHVFTHIAAGKVLVFDILIDHDAEGVDPADVDIPRARDYDGDENGENKWQPAYLDVEKLFGVFYTNEDGTLTPLHKPIARVRHRRHPNKIQGPPAVLVRPDNSEVTEIHVGKDEAAPPHMPTKWLPSSEIGYPRSSLERSIASGCRQNKLTDTAIQQRTSRPERVTEALESTYSKSAPDTVALVLNNDSVTPGLDGHHGEGGRQAFLQATAEHLTAIWDLVAGPPEIRLAGPVLADRITGHVDDTTGNAGDALPTGTAAPDDHPAHRDDQPNTPDSTPNTATPWSGRPHIARTE